MGRLLQKFLAGTTPIGETPSGSVNGSNTSFTLTYTPSAFANVIVTINGVVQEKTEYSVSGTTLTLATAPVTGQSVFAYYSK